MGNLQQLLLAGSVTVLCSISRALLATPSEPLQLQAVWQNRSEGFPERDIYSLGALDYWSGLGQEFFRRRRRRRRRRKVVCLGRRGFFRKYHLFMIFRKEMCLGRS